MNEQVMNLSPMTDCPRFARCDVSLCPLDKEQAQRTYLLSEPRCSLAKSLRTRLGKDLPWRGLFPRELAAWRRWERTGPKEREKFIARSEKYRFVPAPQKQQEENDAR